MAKFDILLTNPVQGGLEPFHHDDLHVVFHLIDSPNDIPLLDGETLIFLNWITPRLSGLEFCRRLRCDRHTANAKIMIIMENGDDDQRRKALRAGADGFITTTVNRQALLDRIMERFRDIEEPVPSYCVTVGDLSLDLSAFCARWRNEIIKTTPKDFRLLRIFCEQPSRVLTRQQIIRAVGQEAEMIDERTVDVWIGRLRRSLMRSGVTYNFRAVRGIGYVFDVN